MATSAGFSTEELNSFLLQNYGVGLTGLTRTQGAEVIKAFQAGKDVVDSRVAGEVLAELYRKQSAPAMKEAHEVAVVDAGGVDARQDDCIISGIEAPRRLHMQNLRIFQQNTDTRPNFVPL
mgnify:CR=1 FL=1